MFTRGQKPQEEEGSEGNFHPKWPSRGGRGSNKCDQAGVGRKAGRNPADGGASEATGRKEDLEFSFNLIKCRSKGEKDEV